MQAASRSPSPRNGSLLIPTSSVGCAGSSIDQWLALRGEGREGEGRGRPMRKVRLMVLTRRPRPEDLHPERAFGAICLFSKAMLSPLPLRPGVQADNSGLTRGHPVPGRGGILNRIEHLLATIPIVKAGRRAFTPRDSSAKPTRQVPERRQTRLPIIQ